METVCWQNITDTILLWISFYFELVFHRIFLITAIANSTAAKLEFYSILNFKMNQLQRMEFYFCIFVSKTEDSIIILFFYYTPKGVFDDEEEVSTQCKHISCLLLFIGFQLCANILHVAFFFVSCLFNDTQWSEV